MFNLRCNTTVIKTGALKTDSVNDEYDLCSLLKSRIMSARIHLQFLPAYKFIVEKYMLRLHRSLNTTS